MKCNIIILSEKQKERQFNICPNGLPMEADFRVAYGFHEGIYQIMTYSFDLIIMNVLQSPEFTEQAVEGIRRLKNTPILSLIPQSEEWKERYIRAGADQVLWDTLDSRELSLAVYALVRRCHWNNTGHTEHKLVQEGRLVINYTSHCATWNGQVLNLSKREFDILFLLAATPGRVYTYEQIYRIIEDESVPENIHNMLWCAVSRIKKKLARTDSKTEGLIQNAKGVGYYFQRPST